MAKRNILRKEFYKTNQGYWKDREGKPDIEYVNWLEDRLVKNKEGKAIITLVFILNIILWVLLIKLFIWIF